MAQSPAGEPSEDRFSLLFRTLPLALALLDEEGQVLDVNPALMELLGRPAAELRGVPMMQLTHPADRPRAREAVAEVAGGARESVRMHKRLRVDGGPATPVQVTLLRLEEPSGAHHRLAQIEDMRADDREQLVRDAHSDQLTGVGNRRALQQRLDPLLSSSEDSPDAVGWSLLFVDLDNFKQVNDALGHAVGDAVLVSVASRLSRLVRSRDLVCRIGGDEFVLILGTAAAGDVRRAEDRIRRSLAQPIAVGAVEVRISASVGSAIPRPDDSSRELLARADAAMYRDKSRRP
jgi:diguanylate cyclase (GGDEF)-like protein/PAS domain S-box-containing protein